MANEHILVVEDEPDISALVVYHLARASYRVRTASTGGEALSALAVEIPDLLILDIMLPEVSGLELLQEIRRREEWREIPVIVLTARREESDRLEGLRLGADDYLGKPFSPQELVLRAAAVLRRVKQSPPASRGGKVLRVGPFLLDAIAARAEVNGREMDLTPTEFRLLQTMLERRGRVQSRTQLLEAVWEVTANIETRTVDMHVQRLRTKSGDAADWIETVRGFGYRFRSSPPAEGDLSRRFGERRMDELGELGSALDTLAGELQRRLSELEEERAETQTLIDSMVEGVIALATLRRGAQSESRRSSDVRPSPTCWTFPTSNRVVGRSCRSGSPSRGQLSRHGMHRQTPPKKSRSTSWRRSMKVLRMRLPTRLRFTRSSPICSAMRFGIPTGVARWSSELVNTPAPAEQAGFR
ncbi:hypothetical protein BH23GEM6_BH23GEM6_12160 [soil metagenome]